MTCWYIIALHTQLSLVTKSNFRLASESQLHHFLCWTSLTLLTRSQHPLPSHYAPGTQTPSLDSIAYPHRPLQLTLSPHPYLQTPSSKFPTTLKVIALPCIYPISMHAAVPSPIPALHDASRRS